MYILIVDDDETVLDRMKKNLLLDHHKVVTASSGEEALEKMLQDTFDLVLMDLQMNELSGIDTIKEMRNRGINSIVIVITGYGTVESAVEAMKTGVYDYMMKPFDVAKLNRKLSEVENELQLRKKISVSETRSPVRSMHGKRPELNLDEFQAPFLVISTRDPADIIREYSLPEAIPVHVSNVPSNNAIPPSKLYQIRNKIEEFVNNQETGTIVFEGTTKLLKAHTWDQFKQFIRYLQDEIISSTFSLLFLKGETISTSNGYKDEILLHDALSAFSTEAMDVIIEVISHPIRKKIITLLKMHGSTNFNKIMEELDIKKSSILAFHIKKLVSESILKKDNNLYSLTPRGEHFDNIIYALEKLGLSDPGSRIRVI